MNYILSVWGAHQCDEITIILDIGAFMKSGVLRGKHTELWMQ